MAFLSGMVGMNGNDENVCERMEEVVVVAGKILHSPQNAGCCFASD